MSLWCSNFIESDHFEPLNVKLASVWGWEKTSPLPRVFFQLPVPNEPPLTHFQHFPPEWVSWQRASEEAKACWTRTVGQGLAEKKATTAPGKMDQYFSKEDVVTIEAAAGVGAKGVASTGGAVLKKSLITIGGHILVLALVHHWSTLASFAHSPSAIEGRQHLSPTQPRKQVGGRHD